MNNGEKNNFNNPEQSFDNESLRDIGKEHSERLQESRNEKVDEQSERALEQARMEVEQATHETEQAKTVERANDSELPRTRKDHKGAYRQTMEEVERHLTPAQRHFSHFIHHPVVEKTSEVIGSTIARPNAILFGAIFAFLFTTSVYVIASKYGYPLSGAETIASFAGGWLFGQLIDYIRIMITGKQ